MKNLPKNLSKFLIVLGAFAIASIVAPTQAQAAAEMYLSPSSSSVNTGDTFSVEIKIDNDGEAITTVDAKVTYPTDLLSLSSVDKTGSFITNWQTEDTSTSGEIRYTGMKPSPGYSDSADALFLTLNFQADAEGTATVSFDESVCHVHKDDEYATDILGNTTGGSYTISDSSTSTTTTDTTDSTDTTTTSTTDTSTPETGLSLPAAVATGWGIAIFLFGLILVF